MRKINRLIVHCSATRPSQDIGAKEIKVWHVRDNGWKDIGYHYVIKRDGTLENGRPLNIAGAHVGGHNADSIGICLVGGVTEKLKSDANFTFKQYETLYCLLKSLKLEFSDATITGHRDWAAKDCPCFDVVELVRYL